MFGQKRIPSKEGGVEVVVAELATRMSAFGHSVTCYNRKGHHVAGWEYDTNKLTEYKGVKLKATPTINRRGLAAASSSFFSAVSIAFGKYDIVHIHSEGPAFFSFIPKMFGKKVIVTIHGLDWGRAKWGGVASQCIKAGEKSAVKFADEIVVLSCSMQEYFWKTYKRETKLIPNGVNKSDVVEVKDIKKWGLEKNGYVLYLGRIVPEKGAHYLIKAWKDISADKKLVIAGGSSDTDAYLSELKELAGDDGRIIFTGFVQGRILEELYSNAYVYCLPSDLEGMPLSLLEAMSYGNCCLTSDIAECAEVVEDKAVLFQKSDVDDLKEKLVWLMSHEAEVEKYKMEAADFITNKYRWDDVVKRTLNLYEF